MVGPVCAERRNAPERCSDNAGRSNAGQGQAQVQASSHTHAHAYMRPDRATLAALDLGTNNCRLLIARPIAEGFRVVDAFSRIVRLGEGLSRTNRLSTPAMARTLEALHICSRKMRRLGVTALRAVATEACRRAENCAEFLALVEAETGIVVEIIPAEEEGRLAISGCAALLDSSWPYALVFDIGGGSTELMWVRVHAGLRPELIDQVSVRCGVVSLAERYGGDQISEAVFEAMIAEVGNNLTVFERRNGIGTALAQGLVQMLGTSGTVTTLAGVHLGLERYERSRVDASYLQLSEARAVTQQLMALDFAGRAAHPCIGQDRADLVMAGCAVLEAICRTWPVGRIRIADRGLREGILVELLAQGA